MWTAFQCVRENWFLGDSVERGARESSPGGANQLSPALQRWEKVEEMIQVPEERLLVRVLHGTWDSIHVRRTQIGDYRITNIPL